MHFLADLPPEVLEQVAGSLTAADLANLRRAVPGLCIPDHVMADAHARDVCGSLQAAITATMVRLEFMLDLTSDYFQTTLTHTRAISIPHFKLGRTKWAIDVRHRDGAAHTARVSVYDDRAMAEGVLNPCPKLVVAFEELGAEGVFGRVRVCKDEDSVGAHLVAHLFEKALAKHKLVLVRQVSKESI